MSKQDGYSSRTAADVERKYNFGKTFAEVYNLISDAQRAAQEAQNAFDGLTKDEIFNLLTDFGKSQGVYRDDDGNVYMNASYIKGGKILAANVEVEAAAITGSLTVGGGVLPSDLAVKGDIPTDVAELQNSLGYVVESNMTTIVGGIVTTDYVNALGISVDAAKITGTLTIGGGVLPEDLAVKGDIPTIPTDISAFTNDSGYVLASNMTTIVGGIVTTDYVNALGISVTNANISGRLTFSKLPTNVASQDDVTEYAAYAAETYIDEWLVSAPTIEGLTVAGGVFMDYEQEISLYLDATAGGNHYGMILEDDAGEIFSIWSDSWSPETAGIVLRGNTLVTLNSSKFLAWGTWDFSNANVIGL